jgi:hypothetical protein
MESLLLKLTAELPAKVIKDGDRPYLERYYLGRAFGLVWYIHRFVASDPDRGLHDHPWRRAISLVLRGWYLEETRLGTRVVRWINLIGGADFHRVVLPDERAVWTLFGHSAIKHPKGWGFLRPYWINETGNALVYEEHVDQDASLDSAAWVATAPKGREVRA